MSIRGEILKELEKFISKSKKEKKDYRGFVGNIRKLMETPLQKLEEKEKKIIQETQEFLNNWQEDYPNIFLKKEDLTNLQNKFNQWFQKVQEQETKISKDKRDWKKLEEKTKELEQGLKLVEWWNKNKSWVKVGGIVFVLLFLWLLWGKIKEVFR